MNQHQTLTGAVNSGDECYSVGSVEGVPFIAYAAGCNIVILASDFTRVQIIPGILHGNVQITCLDCSTDVGKLAVCYGGHSSQADAADNGKSSPSSATKSILCIFEPTPLLDQSSDHKLDYKWIQTAKLESDHNIDVLSWNIEGTKLLSGGDIIQLWHLVPDHDYQPPPQPPPAKDERTPTPEIIVEEENLKWESVWKCRTATPVKYLKFSPDGSLFVSAGKCDRLVKIWYESAVNQSSNHPLNHYPTSYHSNCSQGDSINGQENVTFSFVYIAHPRAVTGVSWRKTSKYVPKGCTANILVTSSRDNICRIWVQTLLPDDGMVNFNQLDSLANDTVPRLTTRRHRLKLFDRIRAIRNFNHYKKAHGKKDGSDTGILTVGTNQSIKNANGIIDVDNQPIPNLPSTLSVHDFHTYAIHGSALTPGLHFHLAASINAETDIPLVPSLSTGGGNKNGQSPNFVMHWMNNKEMVFTAKAEKILHEASQRIFRETGSSEPKSGQGSDVESDVDNISDTGHHTDGGGHSDNGGGLDADDTITAESGKKLRHKLCANSILDGSKSGKKKRKSDHGHGHKESTPEDTDSHRPSIHTVSSSASLKSELAEKVADADRTSTNGSWGDFVDRKFENMLRDWHGSSDLLFSIHPIDGSLLVWLVDWLDETCPGSFRQAQVNFSSRIPSALPLGDASTMSHSLMLYSPVSYLDLRALSNSGSAKNSPTHQTSSSQHGQNRGGQSSNHNSPTHGVNVSSAPTPIVYMVTKHNNGTLNQWSLTFDEKGNKFAQVLSVSHRSRISGHRFRVNDITCHPVLPLLLTTSHHNLPGAGSLLKSGHNSPEAPNVPTIDGGQESSIHQNTGFCSELILWKVDSVGPLSKSGGVTELARINSFEIAAFANVAWIPTLLPSSTLGSLANSPSACFIASDGKQLRVYQAVIDARTILAEVSAAERRSNANGGAFSDDGSSDAGGLSKHYNLAENFKIVSLQSTSRPGCIIELSEINDAIHDWQNTQLLHVFQDQLIKGDKVTLKSWSSMVHGQQDVTSPGLVEPSLGAVVDLRHSAVFEEPFYLVVLEKNSDGQSVIHMWKLVISSQSSDGDGTDDRRYNYVPDSNLIQESDHSNASSRSGTPDGSKKIGHKDILSPLKITTTKVVEQVLPIPPDVEVIHATPAAGHLPSSNIYPACFAPYLIATACSDGVTRFWRCQVNTRPADDPSLEGLNKFKWLEWEMLLNKSSSAIEVPGLPLFVSCAYSGRMAIAYKHGSSYSKPTDPIPGTKYININLNIYECESTGGSEWILEDTIKLKNVEIPRITIDHKIDLEPLIESSIKNKKKVDAIVSRLHSDDTCDPHAHVHEVHDRTSSNLNRLLSVPSYTTMSTLKKIIAEKGNQFTLSQKSMVQLDWVSTEDGSHALTVSVGNKISVFTPVSTDIAQANMQAMKASSKTGTTNTARQLLKQASSMVTASQPDDLKWMAIRTTELKTADGLPPLPMKMSWVRDGILVVGMDNEMHIYTQWKSAKMDELVNLTGLRRRSGGQVADPRVLKENQLMAKAAETSQLRIPSHNIPKSASSLQVSKMAAKAVLKTELSEIPENREVDPQRESILCDLPDFGIFEASRLACPVLPQYHPKQLMELLSFGKIHRVRAILRHLCMSLCSMDSLKSYVNQQYGGKNESLRSPRPYRSRTLSVSAPSGQNTPVDFDTTGFPDVPEEVQLEYTEITSIRPLPLFTLVDAEFGQTKSGLEKMSEADGGSYGGLFDTSGKSQVEETLDEILNRSTFNFSKDTDKMDTNVDLNNFGPRQSRLLTKLLTHSHLPGLSSTDQMHLLALADAVASFNPEKNGGGGQEDDDNGGGQSDGSGGQIDMNNVSTDSLDDCGLRFLLTMRQHTYLLRCLPMTQRRLLHKEGISTSNMVWAFHSETQEELIQLIVSLQRNQLKWSSLRELGVGWWVRNNNVLRRLIEQVAKSSFQVKQDPLDAALFYLAMKKKSLVWGLYRSIKDPKMTDFFGHNFAEDKWRKAALKNAYALLGKQRFEHATAFFLLAGNLWDAVETCLSKLDDVQLAIVIVRLYEGDIETVPETLKKILYKEALGRDKNGENYHGSKAHPDPFLRSMAYWMLQDYSSALTTLLDTDLGYDHPKNTNEGVSKEDFWVPPSVFNFYLYLRTQPLILRRARTANAVSAATVTAESMAEAITPFERRLFFITAHQHFRAGCPSLALEVLSRLPGKIVLDDEDPIFGRRDSDPVIGGSNQASFDESINTGAIANGHLDSASSFDWGAPSLPAAATESSGGGFDWGAPVTDLNPIDTTFKIDINIDSGSDEEDGEGLVMKSDTKKVTAAGKPSVKLDIPGASGKESKDIKLDIMAQQLKFVACLKIIMEELSTLATGYEVDGGQLRYYLYVWLEKSVNALKTICSTGSFSMRGNTYKSFDGQTTSSVFGQELSQESRITPRGSHSSGTSGIEPKPTLHEILLCDKMDFEAKLERSKKRKEWLRANEALLRTLLSYCSLHGAHGGGLASVRMELILLLQELQQERTQHQLLSPLPFPTTLPLLAASVACQKTVIADPLRHLSSMITDVLDTVTSLSSPPFTLPSNYSEIYVLRDLGTSLSACIYQSLCDSDNLQIKPSKGDDPSIVCPNSHLLAGHHATRRVSMSESSKELDPVDPTTPPNKWPGVQSLRALLARDKDEDSPKLHTLLCESYFAVYQSQLLWAFAACDSHMLYRLVAKDFTEKEWSSLFGGGAKKLIHVAVAVSRQPSASLAGGHGPILDADSKSPSIDLLNTLSKQRMKLHMKILQQLNSPPTAAAVGQNGHPTSSVMKEDRPTYREQFIPPKMSILSCLMSKPRLPDELIVLDYDSSESVASEEEEEDIDHAMDDNVHDPSIFGGESGSVHVGSNAGGEGQVAKQLSDHEKYAWGIIRCAVLKLALIHLEQFLVTAGIELNDLPTVSPNIQSVFKSMNYWIECIKKYMDELDGPPAQFLPNVYVESIRAPGTPAINKYRALLELNNTPFKSHNSVTKPAKRLWNYLVRRPQVQDIFVRYVFGKPKSNLTGADSFSDLGTDAGHGDGENNSNVVDIVKIVHRDADQISSFCINSSNHGLMAIATPKEIQELNITPLLDPVPWLEEEAEYDIKNLLKAPEQLANTDYLVVQHPSDKCPSSPGRMAMQMNIDLKTVGSKESHQDKAKAHIMAKHHFPGNTNPKFCDFVIERSRHIMKPMKRHRTEGTRRMAAHPTLPLYVSGSQDGSVTLWEWSHQMAICTPRSSGTFGKVTHLEFNQHGNKFGVSDGDGNLSLWQVAVSSTGSKPFYSSQVHSQLCSDFSFLGSSSLLVTAGTSKDHKNLCLWDTLLPTKKSLVKSFSCHEQHGSAAVIYAPLNQVLITGGRKGDVFIFDMRQRTQRHKFQAHESAVKCLSLDPGEEFFVSGSADGDLKVWSLGPVCLPLYSFPGEHTKSSLFRNIGMGVSHIYVDHSARLYSCGADGSLKLRQLPDRNSNDIVLNFM